MSDVSVMPKSETQIAEERMAAVERQVHKACREGARPLLCPYCGAWNMPKAKLCCEWMRLAVTTVLVADRALKQAEAAERAANN